MKAIFVTVLACIAGALATPATPEHMEIARAVVKNGAIVTGLIPQLNHTIALNESITITPNATNLKGTFSLFNGIVTELDKLSDDLELHVLRLEAEGNVLVPIVRLTGGFELDGELLLNNGLHRLTGNGQLNVTFTGVTAYILVKLRLTALLKVQISSLTVEPSVVSCEGELPGARSDGEQIDLNELCVGIDLRLKEEWAVHGAAILADVTTFVNEILKDMSLQDLIDLITP